MKTPQQRRKPQGDRNGSVCGSLVLLMSVLTLVWGGLPAEGLEICRHRGGETHFFVSNADCAGLHAAQAGHSHPAEDHSGDHGHDGDDEHHEPCDHELLAADGEWTASATRLAVSAPGIDSAPADFGSEFLLSLIEPRFFASFGYSRGPPASDSGSRQFLKTIRLLI